MCVVGGRVCYFFTTYLYTKCTGGGVLISFQRIYIQIVRGVLFLFNVFNIHKMCGRVGYFFLTYLYTKCAGGEGGGCYFFLKYLYTKYAGGGLLFLFNVFNIHKMCGGWGVISFQRIYIQNMRGGCVLVLFNVFNIQNVLGGISFQRIYSSGIQPI